MIMEENETPHDRGPPANFFNLTSDTEMDVCTTDGINAVSRDNLQTQQVSTNNGEHGNVSTGTKVTHNISDDSIPRNCQNVALSENTNTNSGVSNNVGKLVDIHEDVPYTSTASSDKDIKISDSTNHKNNGPDDINKRRERFDEFAKNKYRITDPAPYYVYVEHAEKNVGRLFPIRVGHFLYQSEEMREGIVDIVPIGINRVKVVAKTYSMANKLVDHPSLVKNNLRSYIPTYFTQKKGVVKLVDTMFDNDYLWKNIISSQDVVDIKRLKKKLINRETGREELVDRQTIVVTFLGSTIPNKIRINLCTFPVEPWVYPVVKCYSCLRFGHVASQCRGKVRCSRCGADGHGFEDCQAEFSMCIHCSGKSHHANSRKCPAYVRQHNIKKIMASENVSFKEAEHIADNPSYAKVATHNRFAILDNEENFPSLPKQDAPSTSTSFFIRKPRPANVGSSIQQVYQEKRKAPASSPVSPTPETHNNNRRQSFTKRPRPSLTQQNIKHQSYSQRFYPQQPGCGQSQAQPNISVPSQHEFINLKQKLLANINIHFDSFIKKILPAEVYSHTDTRTNINQFYASLQNLLSDNLVEQNATKT